MRWTTRCGVRRVVERKDLRIRDPFGNLIFKPYKFVGA
jgi:hypothetical protein